MMFIEIDNIQSYHHFSVMIITIALLNDKISILLMDNSLILKMKNSNQLHIIIIINKQTHGIYLRNGVLKFLNTLKMFGILRQRTLLRIANGCCGCCCCGSKSSSILSTASKTSNIGDNFVIIG